MNGLSIVHTIAGLGQNDGGPSYSVPRLCRALGEARARVALLSVAYSEHDVHDDERGGYRDASYLQKFSNIPILRGLRVSPGLLRALRIEAAQRQVLHNHGLWLMPNVYAGRVARQADIPLIVAPRGMLSAAALSFSPLKKRLFWTALQGSALRNVACYHATSAQEYEEIRTFGLTAPVAIVPNGIDIPNMPTPRVSTNQRTLLSLGRIHPKKGLDRLLRAWAQVEASFPNWHLRIVGPSEMGHDVALKALSASLGLARATVQPAAFGEARDALLREADLFVLPTLNENFGLVVAEALAHAIPVISTRGAPWSWLNSERCGWWIDHGVGPLVAALRVAMTLPFEETRRIGMRGREWMVREFSWQQVARDMLDVYSWLVNRDEVPITVKLA